TPPSTSTPRRPTARTERATLLSSSPDPAAEKAVRPSRLASRKVTALANRCAGGSTSIDASAGGNTSSDAADDASVRVDAGGEGGALWRRRAHRACEPELARRDLERCDVGRARGLLRGLDQNGVHARHVGQLVGALTRTARAGSVAVRRARGRSRED